MMLQIPLWQRKLSCRWRRQWHWWRQWWPWELSFTYQNSGDTMKMTISTLQCDYFGGIQLEIIPNFPMKHLRRPLSGKNRPFIQDISRKQIETMIDDGALVWDLMYKYAQLIFCKQNHTHMNFYFIFAGRVLEGFLNPWGRSRTQVSDRIESNRIMVLFGFGRIQIKVFSNYSTRILRLFGFDLWFGRILTMWFATIATSWKTLKCPQLFYSISLQI
jgi:hypothetical protein